MSVYDAMQVVGMYGFPILVALWFMFRTDRHLTERDTKLDQRLVKLDQTIGLLTLLIARSTGQDVAQLRAEFQAGTGNGGEAA